VSEQKTYRVIRGSIRLPRGTQGTGFLMKRADMITQGELVPPGMFTAADIRSWVNEGRIEEAGVSIEVAEEAVAVRAANKFRVDPSVLVGKTMEDLIIMVLEIDEEYDTDLLDDEQAAVQLLTSGWEPSMRQTIAPVGDRSRPEALALHNLEQESGNAVRTDNTDLSAKAQAGLEAAKQRAAAPQSEE